MGASAAPIPTLRAASLFDIDSELAERLGPTQRAEARGRAIVPVADLPAGPWSPVELGDVASRPFALMVVEGLLLRELVLTGSTATELLGPPDIVSVLPTDDALLPAEVQWSVPQAARIVVLDDRLVHVLRAWPGVGRVLLDRAARREARLATHRAIAQLPRVDQRLLAFFAHLGERWGRVAGDGVVLPLQLTHETLGRLIGARRPTVSLALKELAASGSVERRKDGSWLLTYEAFELFGAGDQVPIGWQAADARQLPDGEQDAPDRPPGVKPEDIDVLRKRVEHLRREHADRLSRGVHVLERSRQVRLLASKRTDPSAR
jgi:CRP/FNR family cyclic AMP-dependent transcriptional regulator